MGKRKVLIVLAEKGWIERFQYQIQQEHPRVAKITTFFNSFDEALDSISKEDSYVVISCNKFLDHFSDYRKEYGAIIPDNEKDGAKLAQMMKEKNSKIRFILFSSFNPEAKSKFIDEYVSQYHSGDLEIMDVINVLDVIHEFAY